VSEGKLHADVRWEEETDCDGDDVHTLHVRIAGCLTPIGAVVRMTTGAYSWALRLGDDTQTCEDAETLDAAKDALIDYAIGALSGAQRLLLRAAKGRQQAKADARAKAAKLAAGVP
jgi:hypothetical protein